MYLKYESLEKNDKKRRVYDIESYYQEQICSVCKKNKFQRTNEKLDDKKRNCCRKC